MLREADELRKARENDTNQINAGLMRDLLGAAGKHTPSQTSSTAVTACTAGAHTTIPEKEMGADESSDESSDELQPPANYQNWRLN